MDLRSHIFNKWEMKVKKLTVHLLNGTSVFTWEQVSRYSYFMRYCSGGRFLSKQVKKEKQIWVEVGRTGEKGKEVRTENRPDETNIKRKLRTMGLSMLGIIL